jgi:Uma2 family endonuclease
MITKTRKPRVLRSDADRVVTIPPHAARSLAGFREWYASDDFPDEGRICYLAGELYIEMGHERISSHVTLKTTIARILEDLAITTDVGQYFGDGCRLVDEDGDYSAEPDGCYLTWEAVEEGRVELRESNDGEDFTELVGPVDMVLEVVSPSSVTKDYSVLPELYHQAGVAEYWLIDARKPKVSFTIFRRGRKKYTAVPDKGGWLTSKVFNREFKLTRKKNRIGVWQYTLHVRPLS